MKEVHSPRRRSLVGSLRDIPMEIRIVLILSIFSIINLLFVIYLFSIQGKEYVGKFWFMFSFVSFFASCAVMLGQIGIYNL